MSICKIFLTFILAFLISNNILSKEYILKWFNSAKILDHIEFEDKSKYQITKAEGSWEDSNGNYGYWFVS